VVILADFWQKAYASDQIEIVFIARGETQKQLQLQIKIITDDHEIIGLSSIVSNDPLLIGKLDYQFVRQNV
jgi:2-dehydropantoate 2-reductase